MIISFLSQKGGATKSTLCRAVATAFVGAGVSTHIADLDWQQQTSEKWSARRCEKKEPVSVSVHRRIDSALKCADSYDVLLVDGRAASDQDAIIIAAKSDLIVLPTQTSIDDLEPQLNLANDFKKNGISISKIIFIINRVSSDADARDAIETINSWGFDVSEHYIKEKAAYAKSHDAGLSLLETRYKTLAHAAELTIQSIIDKIEK